MEVKTEWFICLNIFKYFMRFLHDTRMELFSSSFESSSSLRSSFVLGKNKFSILHTNDCVIGTIYMYTQVYMFVKHENNFLVEQMTSEVALLSVSSGLLFPHVWKYMSFHKITEDKISWYGHILFMYIWDINYILLFTIIFRTKTR